MVKKPVTNPHLSYEQKKVLFEKGIEVPFFGEFLCHAQGSYMCVACGAEIFKSQDKYDTVPPGLMGWPSFAEATKSDAVNLVDDTSYWMQRLEVQCAKCGSHLGHLFEDDSAPTGQHYCIKDLLQNKPWSQKVMIFVQNWQIVTRHNRSYGAKQFDLFWAKMALYGPGSYFARGLNSVCLDFKPTAEKK